MKNYTILLLSCLVLAACGDGSFKAPNSNGRNDKLGPENHVCYNDLCIESLFMNELADYEEYYSYPDPTPLGEHWAGQYPAPQYVLNIEDHQQELKVSENFWLKDYTSYRNGTKQFRNAIVTRTLVTSMQNVRDRLGHAIYITSGYRAPGYNEQLNGAATFSRHMYGDGVDIVAPNASATQLKNICDQEQAYFSLAYQDGHAHCDWRHAKLDDAFYPGALDPNLARLDPYLITGGRIDVQDMNKQFKLSLVEFMPFDDHEGLPTMSWQVLTPDGQLIESDKEKLILKKQSGQYAIKLLVGNHVEFEKSVLW